MKKKIIKIGVSGDVGSFSEMSAKSYITTKHLNAELSYLIDMEGVLKALERKSIHYGIFPIFNSNSGLVKEALRAMGKYKFCPINQVKLRVRQCLLSLPGAKIGKIKKIYSYSQPFIQCSKFIKQRLPKAKLFKWADTGKAARDLSLGKFGEDSAVIATENAAKVYGLQILASKIENSKNNITTFIIVKKLKL